MTPWDFGHRAGCTPTHQRERRRPPYPLSHGLRRAHYVRDFTLLRHALLRFLVERCGFTTYALEAPFTEAHAMGAWIEGGPGEVADVAATGMAIDLGLSHDLHDQLRWMRDRNQTGGPRVRLVGIDVPGSGGSSVPALEEVAAHLRTADPDALPLVDEARDHARGHHDAATFAVLQQYASRDKASQDALTAALSRLLARMESISGSQRIAGRGQAHSRALHHLRGAWHVDHLHRDVAGRGLPVAPASRDVFMAESVLRLLDEGPFDSRIVVAAHNVHIQKVPITGDTLGRFPLGHHLANALGDSYVAIGVTCLEGDTAQVRPDPAVPRGFAIDALPLAYPASGSIESAFDHTSGVTIADVRAARPAVADASLFQRIRMEGYFLDVPVLDAFDAVAAIRRTTVDDHVTDPTAGERHPVAGTTA
jgi:erythromycin esterase